MCVIVHLIIMITLPYIHPFPIIQMMSVSFNPPIYDNAVIFTILLTFRYYITILHK